MIEVVILPGLDGTTSMLQSFCAALRARGLPARAIHYPTQQPLDYAGLEPIVRAHLPETGGFVLLGESFSGPLAIRIAADPPVGLRGLVLSTTFARTPVPWLRALAGLTRFAPASLPMPLLSWGLLGRWVQPGIEASLRGALAEVSPEVLRTRAAAALTVDVTPLLPRIQVSVLNLVATHDRLLARTTGRKLARSLPRCQTEVVAGPHLLLQTAPEACADLVAAFALGLDAGAAVGS